MNRDMVKAQLLSQGIQCGYGVLEGLHTLTGLNDSYFPNTTKMLDTILCIPIYPTLTSKQIKYIADEVLRINARL
jgi:dTDP-4-amino-4,6-dideoxygalactose transaminase